MAGVGVADERLSCPAARAGLAFATPPFSRRLEGGSCGDKMLNRVIAAAAALLVTGCMTGPVPVSSSHSDGNSVNSSGPSEEKLPGAPAVRAATP